MHRRCARMPPRASCNSGLRIFALVANVTAQLARRVLYSSTLATLARVGTAYVLVRTLSFLATLATLASLVRVTHTSYPGTVFPTDRTLFCFKILQSFSNSHLHLENGFSPPLCAALHFYCRAPGSGTVRSTSYSTSCLLVRHDVYNDSTYCTLFFIYRYFLLSSSIHFFRFSKRACAYACLRDGGSNINRGLHRGDQVTPSWSAQRPNNQLPNAGLPLINGSEHFLIFTPDSRTDGTYSHGAQIER